MIPEIKNLIPMWYTVSQKIPLYSSDILIFVHNFQKFSILTDFRNSSPAWLSGQLEQNTSYFYHSVNVSLPYVVKYKRSNLTNFWRI